MTNTASNLIPPSTSLYAGPLGTTMADDPTNDPLELPAGAEELFPATQPAPGAPTLYPPSLPDGGPRSLTEHQRNAIARGVVAGYTISQISAPLGIKSDHLRKLIAGDEDIKARIEFVQSKTLAAMAEQQFWEIERLEQARTNIASGLDGTLGTAKEQLALSKWLIERHAPTTNRTILEHQLQGEVDVNAQHAVQGAVVTIAAALPTIIESLGDTNFMSRVKTGDAAIHNPETSAPGPSNGDGS